MGLIPIDEQDPNYFPFEGKNDPYCGRSNGPFAGTLCMTFGRNGGGMMFGDGSIIAPGQCGLIPPCQATKCEYCGRINDMSEHKTSCPGCGAPITGKKMWGG